MRLNLKDQEYGRLYVEDFVGLDKDSRSLWRCKCSCGNICVVKGKYLKNGDTTSCGCAKDDYVKHNNWKGHKEICGDFWSSIQRNAKSRNLEFNISIEYAWNLFIKQQRRCALTGRYIYFTDNIKRKGRGTASLDRINNFLGYIENNVQWLHKDINIAKNTSDNLLFIKMCNEVVNFQNGNVVYTIDGSINVNEVDVIVCVSGYFDPLHDYHIKMMLAAKSLGSKLIVIVNNNSQCKLKKGFAFLDEQIRLTVIKNLGFVDEAILALDKDRSVSKTLQLIKPDIFANGGDATETNIREKEICDKLGIKTVFGIGGANKGRSSSDIIKAFKEHEIKENLGKLSEVG